MATTTKNLTDAQISKLRTEAGQHGDYEQVAICDLALTGAFDRDDYTVLSRVQADRISEMSRDDAYAAIASAINDAAAQA